ncbi:MAG: ABC transporter substrate-binding protein [Candidatus Berkelbacteria bacterium]|nr:ABC transporter substrate-binding protein [Candidatus Berkelbacteria bacterium]
MKFNFKNDPAKFGEESEGLKKPFFVLKRFCSNIKKSYILMSKFERILCLIFLAIALSSLAYKCYHVYLANTKTIPSDRGTYTEAIVGEVKFLNPISAQNDAEKSTSKLLFSGLVRVVDQNTVLPDLAKSWEVASDGIKYTFHLNPDLKFSDGAPLTSADIAYTIESIQSPDSKSPLQATWENVVVAPVDDNTIEFDLPSAYGPFIYSCNFGILPAHLTSDDFSRKLVGSGPYKYEKFNKTGTTINQIELERNDNYYGDRPLLETIKLKFYSDKDTAKSEYEKSKSIDALFGADSNVGNKFDFTSSRSLALIANLRDDKLKDQTVRQAIFEGKALANPASLTLTSLDIPAQREKATELQSNLKNSNINLDLKFLSASQYQDAITNKSYELIFYVFDFGADRDPYAFWHTSQISNLNLAGWSDKSTDILLEDARMILDSAARNKKYDQFFDTIKTKDVIKFYDPVLYNFEIKDNVKTVDLVKGNQPFSRYFGENSWYVGEKRVRK